MLRSPYVIANPSVVCDVRVSCPTLRAGLPDNVSTPSNSLGIEHFVLQELISRLESPTLRPVNVLGL